jgi:simple sugar transport system ATP-binding protein
VAPTKGLAVELKGITKRFPGVLANDDVTFSVDSGRIHAVVGENGAGKSTLMKILYGMQPPDEGSIAINGVTVRFSGPRDAIAAGIGMVHQHFMLAEQLTVLENVVLGAEPAKGVRLDFETASRRIADLSGGQGFALDPDRLVEDLSVGEKQRVEILKVLYRGARILILDEPTAVLVPQEVDALFAELRRLKETGVTIIFISHKLDEVIEIADAVTVIRDGRTVASLDPRTVNAHQLAELMVGSELPSPATSELTVSQTVGFSVEGLSTRSADGRFLIEDVSFRVRKGEVLGIAGVEGNGQRELIETLLGLRPAHAGRIVLAGEDITNTHTRHRRELGLGFIPEDRHHRGLLLPSPLWENAMLGHQTSDVYLNGPWVDRRGARKRTREIVERFDVRTPGVDIKAHALSGGNQQKLIVGREMVAEPKVLVAAHPTRGIDVGAQAAVWEEIRRARAAGMAILIVSSDLDELIGLADTLMVILRGRLVATLDPATVTPAELGAYMTGAEETR